MNEKYSFQFITVARYEIRRFQNLRFARCSRVSDDPVKLCEVCWKFLVDEQDFTIAKKFKYQWCSFFWGVLQNKEIQSIYGEDIWRVIPQEWRLWWIDSVKEKFHCFNDITLETPSSYFSDITEDIAEFKSDRKF